VELVEGQGLRKSYPAITGRFGTTLTCKQQGMRGWVSPKTSTRATRPPKIGVQAGNHLARNDSNSSA
jgi:hypothetical protein